MINNVFNNYNSMRAENEKTEIAEQGHQSIHIV